MRPLVRLLEIALSVTIASGTVACQIGAPLQDPEALAGRWETGDGSGGVVGLSIDLETVVPAKLTTLVGQTEYLRYLGIRAYQRRGAEIDISQSNTFGTGARGGAFWDGRQLRVRMQANGSLPTVKLALAWDAKGQSWSGWFERGAFHRNVVLKRPEPARGGVLSGTWMLRWVNSWTCLHLVEMQDGSVQAWSDSLRVDGLNRYAKGIKPAQETLEVYGLRAEASLNGRRGINVVLGVDNASCCLHPFRAQLQHAGVLVGEWTGGEPGAPDAPTRWKRVAGDSCRLLGASR